MRRTPVRIRTPPPVVTMKILIRAEPPFEVFYANIFHNPIDYGARMTNVGILNGPSSTLTNSLYFHSTGH